MRAPELPPGVELLTDQEHQALESLATAWKDLQLAGVTRGPDQMELGSHMHSLQNAVLANAAARAYPHMYRLTGALPDGH